MAGTGYVAWRFFVAPLRIPLNEDDMALAVERRHPELGDRLQLAERLLEERRGDRGKNGRINP